MDEEIYKLEKLEALYPDEWIAVELVEYDEQGMPSLVRLIHHGRDKDQVFKSIKEKKAVGFFFTGKIFEDDQGYIL